MRNEKYVNIDWNVLENIRASKNWRVQDIQDQLGLGKTYYVSAKNLNRSVPTSVSVKLGKIFGLSTKKFIVDKKVDVNVNRRKPVMKDLTKKRTYQPATSKPEKEIFLNWQKLEERRLKKHFTMEKVSRRAGQASGFYSKARRGDLKVKVSVADRICKVLGVKRADVSVKGFHKQTPLTKNADIASRATKRRSRSKAPEKRVYPNWKRFEERRRALKMTRKELSIKIGHGESFYSNSMSKDVKLLTSDIDKLCSVLGVERRLGALRGRHYQQTSTKSKVRRSVAQAPIDSMPAFVDAKPVKDAQADALTNVDAVATGSPDVVHKAEALPAASKECDSLEDVVNGILAKVEALEKELKRIAESNSKKTQEVSAANGTLTPKPEALSAAERDKMIRSELRNYVISRGGRILEAEALGLLEGFGVKKKKRDFYLKDYGKSSVGYGKNQKKWIYNI